MPHNIQLDNRILFLCLLDGEDTPSAFPIVASANDTVEELKNLIKAKKTQHFDGIAANDLTLLHVTDQYTGEILHLNDIKNGDNKKCDAPKGLERLSEVFPKATPHGKIIIIVQRPSQDPLFSEIQSYCSRVLANVPASSYEEDSVVNRYIKRFAPKGPIARPDLLQHEGIRLIASRISFTEKLNQGQVESWLAPIVRAAGGDLESPGAIGLYSVLYLGLSAIHCYRFATGVSGQSEFHMIEHEHDDHYSTEARHMAQELEARWERCKSLLAVPQQFYDDFISLRTERDLTTLQFSIDHGAFIDGEPAFMKLLTEDATKSEQVGMAKSCIYAVNNLLEHMVHDPNWAQYNWTIHDVALARAFHGGAWVFEDSHEFDGTSMACYDSLLCALVNDYLDAERDYVSNETLNMSSYITRGIVTDINHADTLRAAIDVSARLYSESGHGRSYWSSACGTIYNWICIGVRRKFILCSQHSNLMVKRDDLYSSVATAGALVPCDYNLYNTHEFDQITQDIFDGEFKDEDKELLESCGLWGMSDLVAGLAAGECVCAAYKEVVEVFTRVEVQYPKDLYKLAKLMHILNVVVLVSLSSV
ncbi:hypothetical protein BGW38_000484 [Lunasporangiospora selenospora]|uniref:Crinkler effector protein N-terminal domain-containing protein n=1 Tax=Lunasporangiospora selenospora TaxID=979761 RepID=A0A9P6FVL2_9FUNG|nr:hypothetical protein BGW38_000484 [Lunasporangiospora selenospora]